MTKKLIVSYGFLALFTLRCPANAKMTTAQAPTPCTYNNRNASFPASFDFTAMPTGFTHMAFTDQMIASGGVGVLQSVTGGKFDILYSTTALSAANTKLKTDFNFAAGANNSNNVMLFMHWSFASNAYYQAQIDKSGVLFLVKLAGSTLTLQNFTFIATPPAMGTLELSICNGVVTATVGADAVSVTDNAPLTSGVIAVGIDNSMGGSAGSVSIDNLGVFVP